MKMKLAFASVLVLSGCGPSREAMQALQDMQIMQNNPDAGISYDSVSGWGNDLTLNNVEVRAPAEVMAVMTEGNGDNDPETPAVAPDAKPATVARAKTMSLKGLTLKDGKPVARDIMLNEITPTIPTEGATISLGSIGFEGMNEATGLYIASAFTKDGPGEVPALENWAFKKAGLSGLSLAIPIPQDEAGQGAINVQLGELSLSDFAKARIGLMRFAGLKGDLTIPGSPAIDGKFDFGKMDLSGINTQFYADMIAAGVQPVMNPGVPVDYAALYGKYPSPIEPGFDAFDWTGMAVNVSGLKFDASALKSVVKRNADGVAIASDMPRAALKFTADSSGGTLGAMGLMVLAMGGYDSNVIEMYTEGHTSFDPAKDLTRWDGITLGVTDAFDVKLSGGILGLKQAMPALAASFSSFSAMVGEEIGGDLESLGDSEDSEANDEDADEDEADVTPDSDDQEGHDADDDHAGHESHADHSDHAGHEDHADHEDDESSDGDDADADEDEDVQDHAGHGGMAKANSAMVGMQFLMAMMPLQLTDLDISITDQKLVNMILEPQAISAGQTVEAYRQDLVNMVTASSAFLADAGVDPAISAELTTAVSGFLSGPGTFHIVLKPKAPLGAMSVMMTPMTKENLGFSATFTPAVPPAPKVN